MSVENTQQIIVTPEFNQALSVEKFHFHRSSSTQDQYALCYTDQEGVRFAVGIESNSIEPYQPAGGPSALRQIAESGGLVEGAELRLFKVQGATLFLLHSKENNGLDVLDYQYGPAENYKNNLIELRQRRTDVQSKIYELEGELKEIETDLGVSLTAEREQPTHAMEPYRPSMEALDRQITERKEELFHIQGGIDDLEYHMLQLNQDQQAENEPTL
ncbi:hypothetical protein [Neptuniibacter sp. QD37_11]|uniref:hypothetical protein n=1 Tax=Neptuniibacter sp. QD37_11 TaxID=3398209 RepID=UPI0039F4CD23